MAEKKIAGEDSMVEVETLTQIGLPGRDGYVAKGDRTKVSVGELSKNPEAYALLKQPSAKLEGQVAEIQEREGVAEKSSLAEANVQDNRGTVATAPDYETDPTKYDEHVEEMSKKSKGSKK